MLSKKINELEKTAFLNANVVTPVRRHLIRKKCLVTTYTEEYEFNACSCNGYCGGNFRYSGCSCNGYCGGNYRKD